MRVSHPILHWDVAILYGYQFVFTVNIDKITVEYASLLWKFGFYTMQQHLERLALPSKKRTFTTGTHIPCVKRDFLPSMSA